MSGDAWVSFVHHVFSPRLYYHQLKTKTIRGGVTLRAIKLPSCFFDLFVVRVLVLLPPPPNHNAIRSPPINQPTSQHHQSVDHTVQRQQSNKQKQATPTLGHRIGAAGGPKAHRAWHNAWDDTRAVD
jgi:hypothetical protein